MSKPARALTWVRPAILVVGILLFASTPVSAAGKVHRIGVLDMVNAASNAENLGAFRQGLKDFGYVEGESYVIEHRSADGHAERCIGLSTELVQLGVDVIVTTSTPAALATKQVTKTIPVVMASSGDPTAEGIVSKLARPDANVTGLHAMAPPELGGKRLQLLREVAPGSKRIGILWNSIDIQAPLLVRDTERAAKAMHVHVTSFELQRVWPSLPAKAFDEAFEEALLGQVDAIITVEDSLTLAERARVVSFAAMSRLPAIYGLREFVDAGGLMSYGTDRRDLYRRSARYVHRILSGARPADLPVEPPTRFALAINLKTARALGLTVPASLLHRADHIVQ